MLENVDIVTADQLKGCAISVANKNKKYAISDMFSTEWSFVSDCLKKCFFRKYKSRFLELDSFAKQQ